MFYVSERHLTDGSKAYTVMFRDEEIYAATDEPDALVVRDALNAGLKRGLIFSD